MTENANIVCMKWGTKYGADYVNNLYNMISRNITRPFRFICFTDIKDEIRPEVEVFDLPPFNVPKEYLNTAYRKKTLCRKDLAPFKEGERFLFLDLDVIVMDNIDEMFDFEPDKDFIICYNWTRLQGRVGNSSVTMMRVGPLQYITDDLEANFIHYKTKFKTASQEYMSSKVVEGYGQLTFWPQEWCRSFQSHLMPNRIMRLFKAPPPPPAGTKILLFHGMVNPPDAIKGEWPGTYPWWKRWYKTLKPTPWLEKYWK